jgi:hypothetical protein
MSKFDKPNIIKILVVLFVLITAGAAAFLIPKKSVSPHQTNPPAQIEDPKPEAKGTTLFFAGDIMLSRNVANKMYQAQDFTLPFRNVADITKNADIAFANLESPFNDTGSHFIDGSLVFNADPKSVEGLKFAGFDILSTANNHSMDQGQKGLEYTLNLLNQNQIIPSGTSSPSIALVEPVIQHNDILFGFLSYSYTAYNDGGKSKSPNIKDANDLTGLKQDILAMKGHTADVVIVSMHAGTEYKRTPNPSQIDFAHAAIDAGADLVIGHHPHWIQTVEKYKDKWIFYSLGNFVFDQMWSQDTREGLTLLATFETLHIPDPQNLTAGEDKMGFTKFELKPVIIDNFCCPRWASEDETKSILQKINLTSTSL